MFEGLLDNLSSAIAEMKKYIVNLSEIPSGDYSLVFFLGGEGPEGAEEKVKVLRDNASAILKRDDMNVGGIDMVRKCHTNFLYIPPQSIVKIIAPCHCCYPSDASIAYSFGRELAAEGKLVIVYGSGPSGLRAHILLPFTGESVREMEW